MSEGRMSFLTIPDYSSDLPEQETHALANTKRNSDLKCAERTFIRNYITTIPKLKDKEIHGDVFLHLHEYKTISFKNFYTY